MILLPPVALLWAVAAIRIEGGWHSTKATWYGEPYDSRPSRYRTADGTPYASDGLFCATRLVPLGAVNAFGHKGHIWFHASISHPDRLPTYDELCNLKAAVFGKEGIAAQVFEAERYHVNIHPNCLHLWGPRMASAWPLPRFKEGTI